VGFEFGEGHFDRIEIWAVWRQEEEPAALDLQDFGGFGAFVDAEVVQNDDGAGCDGWGELGCDVAVKGFTVHGALDDPRRNQAVCRQARDKGLGIPKARWCAGMQASALQGPPTRPRHVGFDGGLVNEDQPVRCLPHHGLAMAYPIGPGAPDRGAALLIRDQRLFLTVKPMRRKARQSAPWLTETPSASRRAAQSSASVMSGS
jgi:hypothetical protein